MVTIHTWYNENHDTNHPHDRLITGRRGIGNIITIVFGGGIGNFGGIVATYRVNSELLSRIKFPFYIFQTVISVHDELSSSSNFNNRLVLGNSSWIDDSFVSIRSRNPKSRDNASMELGEVGFCDRCRSAPINFRRCFSRCKPGNRRSRCFSSNFNPSSLLRSAYLCKKGQYSWKDTWNFFANDLK